MREYRYEGDTLYLKCNICGKYKGLECFNRDCSKEFGYRTNCKDCRKPRCIAYYNANKNKIIERGQRWVENNRAKSNDYKKKYRDNNKDKVSECIKNNRDRHTNELGFNWDTFHVRATQFVRKYSLRPKECPICGDNKNIVIHHPSYDKYDERRKVVFCCQSCHKKIHCGQIECPQPIWLKKV